MVFVYAQAVVALVVDLLLPRDETEVVGINHEMNSNGLTVETHSWIPTTSSFARMGSSPNMTRAGKTLNLETKMDNIHVGFDLGKDLLPSAHQRFSRSSPIKVS
jgi:hypothetical protein